jgi:hypothetical protein
MAMIVRSLRVVLAAAVLAAASLALEPAYAAAPPAQTFFTRLSGSEEVPPRETDGQGTAVFRLSPDGTKLSFTVLVNGINNVVAAHVHSAPVGVNGPIVLGLFEGAAAQGSFNGVLSMGTVVRGDPLPASLGATLTHEERFDALIALLRSGDSYVNVHTNDGVDPINTGPGDFPGGEIRGQLEPRP